MKKEVHPQYGDATIVCACGTVVKVKSTRKEMHINTCSVCHPFFTGRAAHLDARGRVEQFRKRYSQK